jgi:hypothetical protein
MPPPSGYANIKLYQNLNLIPSPNKEKKLKPFLCHPLLIFLHQNLFHLLLLSTPPNISSIGLNLTEHGIIFSNVGVINQSSSSRSSINIIPLPEIKSKARPNSPLLLSGAQKKRK